MEQSEGSKLMGQMIVVAATATLGIAVYEALREGLHTGALLLSLAVPFGLLFLGAASAFTKPRSLAYKALLFLSMALCVASLAVHVYRLF